MQGYVAGVWAVASVVGPTLGGSSPTASWRWIFFINLPLGLVAAVSGVAPPPRGRSSAAGTASTTPALCC